MRCGETNGTAVCDPDMDLVERAQQGDRPAFETLIHRHEQRVFRTTLAFTRNTSDAEDAMQNTFLKAYCKLRNFRREARFTTWLTRIAVNESLMMLRGRRPNIISLDQKSEADESVLSREVRDGGPSQEECFAQAELGRILSRGINLLHADLRVVFVLRYNEQLPIRIIGKALSLSVPAVKSRLHRGRVQLRTEFQQGFQSSCP